MKAYIYKVILPLVVLLLARTGASHESSPTKSIDVSLGGVVTQQMDDNVTSSADDTSLGGTLLIEFPVRERVGIETGILVINREYRIESGDYRISQEVQRVHIPVLARYWFFKPFSLGAGPYLDVKAGNEKTVVRKGGATVARASTSADEDFEIGADFSATYKVKMDSRSSLFLEGRYMMPFNKDEGEDSDVFAGLAGFRFQI